MKLLLTSAGFTTSIIADECVSLVGKEPSEISFAVINEAYAVENEDHKWILDELSLLRSHFSGPIEFVNLLALDIVKIKERLSAADVIYVVGGNTDYLMNVFQSTGLCNILPDLLESCVYVGSSAGSMVMGKRVSTQAYQQIYGEGDTFGTTSYCDCLDLAIKPHLNSPEWPNNIIERLQEVSVGFDTDVYGLSDTSAIVSIDRAVKVIGNDWVELNNGDRLN